MNTQPTTISAQKVQALNRLPMFGPAPLLKGEDAAAYDDLLARVSGTLKPSDIFEEIWVREVVDLIWENQRWRRHQAACIKAAVPKLLGTILQPLVPEPVPAGTSFMSRVQAASDKFNAAPKLAGAWAANDADAIKSVEDLLATAGLTLDDVTAQAVAHELDKIERFNRLIANAEWRRTALLREIDRRRASFAQKIRNEIGQIEGSVVENIEAESSVADEAATRPVVAAAEVTPTGSAIVSDAAISSASAPVELETPDASAAAAASSAAVANENADIACAPRNIVPSVAASDTPAVATNDARPAAAANENVATSSEEAA